MAVKTKGVRARGEEEVSREGIARKRKAIKCSSGIHGHHFAPIDPLPHDA